MSKVIIRGEEYTLRLDLDAMEQIEDAFGSLRAVQEVGQGNGGETKTIKKLFVIMVNCARDYAGRTDMIDESVLKHGSIGTLRKISDGIREAMNEAMRAETVNGGPADDETHDAYLEEIEAAEKKRDGKQG